MLTHVQMMWIVARCRTTGVPTARRAGKRRREGHIDGGVRGTCNSRWGNHRRKGHCQGPFDQPQQLIAVLAGVPRGATATPAPSSEAARSSRS